METRLQPQPGADAPQVQGLMLQTGFVSPRPLPRQWHLCKVHQHPYLVLLDGV